MPLNFQYKIIICQNTLILPVFATWFLLNSGVILQSQKSLKQQAHSNTQADVMVMCRGEWVQALGEVNHGHCNAISHRHKIDLTNICDLNITVCRYASVFKCLGPHEFICVVAAKQTHELRLLNINCFLTINIFAYFEAWWLKLEARNYSLGGHRAPDEFGCCVWSNQPCSSLSRCCSANGELSYFSSTPYWTRRVHPNKKEGFTAIGQSQVLLQTVTSFFCDS